MIELEGAHPQRPPKRPRLASHVWTIALAVFTATLVAQTPQAPPQQPTFRTEANYVRVDVYPTKDGVPVADLKAEDFEVLENGAPQKVEQFEHVVIRAAGPQETRIEPNTVAEMRAMAENPRARIMVVFLDTYHVDIGGSHNIRKPLVDALDKVIGQDDLVGVMTPEMSARDITFARKTTTIDGFLTRYWTWGERDRMTLRDPQDQGYAACYPNVPQNDRCADQNGVAAEMIDRRHEKLAIDALEDLVRYLRGVREERKAILAVTNGWLLYQPNSRLMRPLTCEGVPTGPTVGIDPRTGRLTTKDPSTAAAPRNSCQADRMNLAQIDDERSFRDLLDEANAANASFYPIDPRGLAVFDTPIMRTDVPGPAPPMVPLAVDRAMLTTRLTSLRTLAENTDGLAIVNSNDLAGGLQRVVADLSSYYLLGYYSSGKLDGRFHSITVRVKRPGVQVRARRGYLAATPGAVNAAAAARAAAAVAAAPDSEASAISAALAPLPGYARDVPVRVEVTSGWKAGAGGEPAPAFWVVGEFTAASPGERSFDATVIDASGATVARGSMQSSARGVLIPLATSATAAPGEYTVRVRGEGASAGSVTITLPPSPDASGAVLMRRGLNTGNRDVPTADRRFRRNEQLRVEIPVIANTAPRARLLDRAGKALAVPVTAGQREDADGSRWVTAQLALAPLAPSDYIVEITAGGAGGAAPEKRTLVAFRIVP
jgi:VWFA-related protein